MNLKIGIVGLPNVGKSTLFNALTKSSQAEAANFPFCTIDPNVGFVEVPDKRIEALCEIVNPQKFQKSVVEFVDIAGLVEGASQGEGLGNKFLSHIRECDAITHVLRDFEDGEVHHVSGKINAKSDFSVILMELVLADLESVQKQIERLKKKSRVGDKESVKLLDLLGRYEQALEDNQLANSVELTEDEKVLAKTFQLLTQKPFLILANVSEAAYASFDTDKFRQKIGADAAIPIIAISAKLEAELSELEAAESQDYLESLGIEHSGLENLIQAAFGLLNLQVYFTAGVTEVRSWTIKKGAKAPEAAGAIHTDFEKGFIKADVIAYSDFVACGGESGAKEKGKMRLEGKEYVVMDGDVMHFKFNN